MLMARDLLQPAQFSDLGSDLQTELIQASASLASLPRRSASAIEALSEGRFSSLYHRLSPHFMELNVTSPIERRSDSEVRALQELSGEFGPGLPLGAPEFSQMIGKLNAHVTEGTAAWRDEPAYLVGDIAGNRIQLPGPHWIPSRIEALHAFISENNDCPAIFVAITALALLVNTHPFSDGNGRTSRVLFNLVLRRGGMPEDVYFPFYEIARRSRGGYEIALRCAELQGDWRPLMRYVLGAIRCYAASEQVS